MEIKNYVEMYKDLLKEVSPEVALKLIEQFALDKRTEFIAEYKANEPATEKQLKYIDSLSEQGRIPPETKLTNLTKDEAGEIINKAVKG